MTPDAASANACGIGIGIGIDADSDCALRLEYGVSARPQVPAR